MLHRIADEDQFQVELFGELEEAISVLMAEHRGFIDDDPAALRRLLHLFIEQEPGNGVDLEAVLLPARRPRRWSWPDR